MFIWNRTEVLTTLSKEYYLRVRALLQSNHIKQQGKQVPIPKNQTAAQELVGQPRHQYSIYVHKDDLDRARELIAQLGPEDPGSVRELEW